MKNPPSFSSAKAVCITLVLLFIGCSGTPGPEEEISPYSVYPSAGPPGAVLSVKGVNTSGVSQELMEILIAGEAAPASIGSNGNIITAVPMFLDGSGLPDPPTGKADIDIYEDGDLLARIEDGVTIEVFPSAPGTFDEAVTVLDDIAATVDSISNFLVTAPGAGESYTYAFFVALDSLLNGDGEYSLAEVLKDQTEDSVAVILLNGLYETNGIVGHLRTMSEMFGDLYAEMDAQAASGRSAGLSPLAPSAEGPYIVDDDLLALMMQVYVVMRIFGQEFIAETGAEFANTIGTIMGAVGLSGRLQGPGRMVAITQAILAYLDFVVNKVAIGFLPAHLDILDLSLASNEIMQGTKTQATITATASNDPATITLNYLVGNTLTLLGLGESSTLINPTTQLLEDIASYFLGLAQGALSSYADSHPELDLDVELGSIVPAMVWKAEVDDYRLVVLHSDDQDLLAPMEYENNWQSSSQYEGLADIWVIPSVDSEAHVLPAVLPINYAGGAFGEDITLSNREEVDVLGRLALEIDFPSSVEYEGAGALGIRAGYRQLDGTIVWSPDIDIAISVTGGTPEQSIGTTDSEGHFSTVVHADVPGFEEMTIRVMASGDQDSYGEKEITAQIDHCGGHTFELIWNCPSVWDCQEYFRTEFCVTSSLPDCYWHMHIFDYWSDGSLTGDDRGDYFGETGCATYIHYGDCTGTGVLVRIELLLTVSCFDGEGCDIGTIEERVVIPMP